MIDPAAALMVAGGAVVLVGLAMAGAACGRLFDVPALLVASLVIGAEELLETSVVSATLGAELRRRSGTVVG